MEPRTLTGIVPYDVWETCDQMPPESKGRFAVAWLQNLFFGTYDDQNDVLVRLAMTAHKRKADASVERHLKAIQNGKQGAADGKDGGRPTSEMKKILDDWNHMAEELNLPKQKCFTGSMMKAIKHLFASGESVEDIIETLHMVENSAYLKGESKDGVKAHFAWMLEHYEDVKSGKYASTKNPWEGAYQSNPF